MPAAAQLLKYNISSVWQEHISKVLSWCSGWRWGNVSHTSMNHLVLYRVGGFSQLYCEDGTTGVLLAVSWAKLARDGPKLSAGCFLNVSFSNSTCVEYRRCVCGSKSVALVLTLAGTFFVGWLIYTVLYVCTCTSPPYAHTSTLTLQIVTLFNMYLHI